jgi:hypothetical protein
LRTTACGFRTFVNFRIAIRFHHGKLDLIPQQSPKKLIW